ncbi:hypothetical protein LSUB1_G004128 [Lachnellula subtilissima]|uniref:Uncharacterized protein n=1 Tax=Lachnellula subtilissima TaxID=602034 RepID=A0A8H8UAN2_9HELO|nr:hypothetical protein LSUB1_G004128 [Lachnellula subtilissima]
MMPNTSKRTFNDFSEANGTGSSPSNVPPSSKRSRAAEPNKALWDQICKLSPQTTQNVLYEICMQNPAASAFVQSADTARLAEESNKPSVNFDSYSKSCWHTLNTDYKRLSGSKQYEAMGDIYSVLSNSREAIMKKAGPDTKWGTRRNALEVLRKICKSIVLCNEQQIRHEILKDGYVLMGFTDSMLELAMSMSQEERDEYKQEGLYEKLVELQSDCNDWETDMGGLGEIYELFDGIDDGEGDEEGDEDEDEDEEEDEASDSYQSVVEIAPTLAPEPAPPQRKRVFSVIELS